MKNQLAIVVSEFNKEVTDKLLEGTISKLTSSGIAMSDINIYAVPGAVEIPLTTLLLAKKNRYQAIICLGAVIRGDTDHYDYVCQQVSQGCQRIMLDYEIPVIFGVLTTHSLQQALDRVGGKEGHKGIECAEATLKMLNTIQKISPS